MKMIMARFQRFERFRQLHTIISEETIQPSSQTPRHLKTHNLSILDQFAPNMHMSWVFFYRNYKNGGINDLKKSLSQCLTKYYPFAGRFMEDHIECNDTGVNFLEASNDRRLDDFILKKEQDENLYQLVPNGIGSSVDKMTSPNLVEVQLNHFTDGGAALTMSISHKIGDAFTMVNFFKHWATITRGGSPINPNFLSYKRNNFIMPELALESINDVKYVIRKFVFPNSKLNDLKEKVISMGIAPMNPSRVEVLTSLIFKCSVDAATTKSGFLQPTNLSHTVNIRNKIIKNDIEKAPGNIFAMVIAKMAESREIRLNEVVDKLRKAKMDLEGLRDEQEVGENLTNILSMLRGDPSQRVFTSSSLCQMPLNEVDFGWGKPVEATLIFPNVKNKGVVLMDTPQKDGIEVILQLPEEEMVIFQGHKELLTYVNG